MQLTLTIPDETYAELQHAWGNQQAIRARLGRLIADYRDVSPTDRSLRLDAPSLATLEAKLGNGQVTSSQDLVAKVDKLAKLTIGGIEEDFTAAQWQELQGYAHKRNLSLQDAAAGVVREMASLFFNYR